MKRRLLNLLTVLSLMLCVVAAGMWADPRFRAGRPVKTELSAPPGHGYGFLDEGLCVQRFEPLRPPAKGPTPIVVERRKGDDTWEERTFSPATAAWRRQWPVTSRGRFGFHYRRVPCFHVTLDPWCTGFLSEVVVPYWFIVAAAAILPVARTIAMRRHWGAGDRMRNGLCPSCGYDLRATPGRCPECGSEPATPT